MKNKITYYCLVNNLRATVFDSQTINWLKMLETKGINFNIILIPPGIKNYLKELKLNNKKFYQIRKILNGKLYLLFKQPSFLILFFCIYVILIHDLIFSEKIVIQSSNPALYKIIKWLKNCSKKIIFIYDCQGASAEKYLLSNIKKNSEFMYNKRVRDQINLARISDKIIVLSNKLKEYILEKEIKIFEKSNIKDEVFSLIPCGADENFFFFDSEVRHALRNKLGIMDRQVFIYCGALDKAWQIPDFIFNVFKILKKNNPNSFFICLTPNHDIVDKYVELYKIDKNDVMIKFVNNSEINNFLCASDMGFLFRENVVTNNVAAPTKLVEYLMSGLPVLISEHIGDYSEFVLEHDLGVVINNNLDELATIIQDIDFSKYNKENIAQIGKKFLSKQVYIDKMYNLYKYI